MNLKHIKLVVFDMAGTTVDEQNVVYKTLQKAINTKNLDVSLEEVLEHGAGKEKYQAIIDILQATINLDLNDEFAREIFNDFQELLDEAYEELEVETFEGVLDLFSLLRQKDINIALNTGYNSRIANLLLYKLDWELGREYDLLITANDVENSRPNPEMIELARTHFKITKPSQVLKAGDSTVDILEGKNANCGITVGVLSGAQTKKQLEKAKPDLILDSLKDLITYFK
jgi:phosphonatase-like hydrolase